MPDPTDMVSRETGEVVSRETTITVPAADPVARYNGETYEEMQATADTVFGAELEQGNLLIGVPFIAIRLTYRPGEFLNPVTNSAGHYVSIDLITGTEREINKGIRRGRITEPCEVEPGEHLVINEGGTGVYRQTVGYLEAKGWITLPDGPENGAYGESRFDTAIDSWQFPGNSPAELRIGPDGQPVVTVNIRLECPRGLRKSEYENAYTRSGVTRYIA